MNPTRPVGWPGDEAARDGAPLDGGGPPDARLVAAERVIVQLRTLLGALAERCGDPVLVTPQELSDPRLRQIRIVAALDGVHLHLPVPATNDEAEAGSGAPTGELSAGVEEIPRAGDSPLMRRLTRVLAERSHSGDDVSDGGAPGEPRPSPEPQGRASPEGDAPAGG